MPNTSATGGYLSPVTAPLPGGLTIEQYLQQVVSGITGIAGSLVRPRWQETPPKSPQINVNWCAIGITVISADANAYVVQQEITEVESSKFLIHERLKLFCSFYGPAALSNAALLRDGLQLSQNREKLFIAGMGYTSADEIVHIPELVNERWVNRADINIYISREISRKYDILSLVDAEGTIETDKDPQLIVPWTTENITD